MRISRIADLIDSFYSSIYSCIESNSEIRSVNIFIDRTCNANTGNVKLIAEIQLLPEKSRRRL